MANIIPMAGAGARFAKEGYILPKPLIPVSGKPMILQVIKTLPKSDKWIFVIRKEHIKEYAIDRLIKKEIPKAIVVSEENPKGQATSCMMALPYLEPNEPMLVAACDNGMVFDEEKFKKIAENPSVDFILWTFTENKLLSEKPEAWGWAVLENDGTTVRDMSVKIPVSANPFLDHAVVATFYFKKAEQFQKASELMVKEEYRINNEFYLDAMPLFYKKLGLRTVIFDVDLYVGWGKPSDLHEYENKEYFWQHQSAFWERTENRYLWEEFFKLINQP